MGTINWNELRDRAYQNAVKHGWYEEYTDIFHHMMMFVTELGEVVNADRKGQYANRTMFELNFYRSITDPERHWIFCYETYIKDTVEDELADAVIRLLSFAGWQNYEIDNSLFSKESFDDFIERFKDNRMTTLLFCIIMGLNDENINLSDTLYFIISVAYMLNIDIFWYIEQKMKYNEMRPYKHGKKY